MPFGARHPREAAGAGRGRRATRVGRTGASGPRSTFPSRAGAVQVGPALILGWPSQRPKFSSAPLTQVPAMGRAAPRADSPISAGTWLSTGAWSPSKLQRFRWFPSAWPSPANLSRHRARPPGTTPSSCSMYLLPGTSRLPGTDPICWTRPGQRDPRAPDDPKWMSDFARLAAPGSLRSLCPPTPSGRAPDEGAPSERMGPPGTAGEEAPAMSSPALPPLTRPLHPS